MLDRVVQLIDEARRSSARAVNAVMTATYWLIGRHIVEFEQAGKFKVQYGKEIIDQLASDLTPRFGRGFTRSNLFHMRAFYAAKPRMVQTVSGKSAIRKERALVLRQPTESIATPVVYLAFFSAPNSAPRALKRPSATKDLSSVMRSSLQKSPNTGRRYSFGVFF